LGAHAVRQKAGTNRLARCKRCNCRDNRHHCPGVSIIRERPPAKSVEYIDVQIPEGDSREHPIASKIAKAFVKARLSEAYDQKAHTPTKEEVARKKDWNWYQPKKWDYVPSGRLRRSVENLPYGVKSVRRMWSDAKKQRLEDCLGDFILNLGVIAKALKLGP